MTSNAQRLGHPAADTVTPFGHSATEVKIVVSDHDDEGWKKCEVFDAAGERFGFKFLADVDDHERRDLLRDAGIFVVDFINGKPVIEGCDEPDVQSMLDKFWADGGSKRMGRGKAA